VARCTIYKRVMIGHFSLDNPRKRLNNTDFHCSDCTLNPGNHTINTDRIGTFKNIPTAARSEPQVVSVGQEWDHQQMAHGSSCHFVTCGCSADNTNKVHLKSYPTEAKGNILSGIHLFQMRLWGASRAAQTS